MAAELVIPPAETHVIGDVIPLFWRFTNRGDEPLGFMWEGCCRLNGRLDVTALGRRIELIPPGQALAHMFAKAEVLQPGKGRDFDTRLSDWVRLAESGTYTLAGQYVGVRPEQRPQVPRGTKLWREAATTAPITVTVLSVGDYLNQRDRRAAARAVSLTLTGSSRLPPLRPAPLELRMKNTGREPARFTWPNDFQLWIVDRDGHRLGPGGTLVEGSYEEFVVEPGTEQVRAVPFHSGLIEGEPFGDYQVFIDLADSGLGRPRVPSNPIAVRWDLPGDDVASLVNQAAAGPKTGLRNAPLKLLRTYVGELRPVLDRIEPSALEPAAGPLLDQLRLAACLKPVAPKPGRVTVRVQVAPDGSTAISDAALAGCLEGITGPVTNRLAALLQVRRHLGWEIGIDLAPLPAAELGTILRVDAELAAFESDLAGAPQALFAGAATNVTGSITFRREAVPTAQVVRLRGSGPALQVELARGAAPTRDLSGLQYESATDRAALGTALFGTDAGRVLVVAGAGVKWADVIDVLRSGLEKGAQVDLCGER